MSNGNLPDLSLVRFSHDHIGSFATAFAGVNTPETQQADDDLSVGRLVETVAHSPYANSMVMLVTEDDWPEEFARCVHVRPEIIAGERDVARAR